MKSLWLAHNTGGFFDKHKQLEFTMKVSLSGNVFLSVSCSFAFSGSESQKVNSLGQWAVLFMI